MADLDRLKPYLESETPQMRKEKDSIVLLNDRYKTPNTSLLLFHFEPSLFRSSEIRLQTCLVKSIGIEGKDLYVFDSFFLEQERDELRAYSRKATFSRKAYASQESRDGGEEPARSMDNKEKWEFFAKPPKPIKEIYKFLGYLAYRMEADVSTMPWDLCDSHICASAVATNRLEKSSQENMVKGKHEDSSPEEGLPFGIPILYESEKRLYPQKFINGAAGNPWIVSLMVYAHEENFISDQYGLGTIFCKKNGELVSTVSCEHSRFVIFEGDILHSIEESHIPLDVHTWRVSYVFKLLINPKQPGQNIKMVFRELIKR